MDEQFVLGGGKPHLPRRMFKKFIAGNFHRAEASTLGSCEAFQKWHLLQGGSLAGRKKGNGGKNKALKKGSYSDGFSDN